MTEANSRRTLNEPNARSAFSLFEFDVVAADDDDDGDELESKVGIIDARAPSNAGVQYYAPYSWKPVSQSPGSALDPNTCSWPAAPVKRSNCWINIKQAVNQPAADARGSVTRLLADTT